MPQDHDVSAAPPDSSANGDARFRQLFQQSPLSTQVLSLDGRTVLVNQAWQDLWNIRAGGDVMAYVMSAAYNVLTDPQLVATGVVPYLQRAFAGVSQEIPAIYYDTAELGIPGRGRWVTAHAHPVKDDHGQVREVILMHEDITERVEGQNRQREREERWRSLVAATTQIVWTTSADGQVVADSPSWREFTGQSYEQWRGFGWLDALHPDDREETMRVWTEAVRQRGTFEINYRMRRADGVFRWTAVKAVPVMDSEGAVREWIGGNTDVHEAVLAQADLMQRLERERRNAALLAKVASASRTIHGALAAQDIAQALVLEVRDILQVHQAVVSLNDGGDWAQSINAVSLSDKYQGYQHYDAKPDGAGIYAEVCRTNRVMRFTEQELTAHPAWKGFGAHAGEHPPMRGWLAVPLIDRTGRNLGLIQASDKYEGDFTAEDEAILVQLASIAANGFENARLYTALQEQDQRKDEFLAMLAHELRNPLAPISAAAEILRKAPADPARVRHYGDIIARQVNHMMVLMNDLMDVSRVTRGMVELDKTAVSVDSFIRTAAEQVRPLIDARGHALVLQIDAAQTVVLGDKARLVQVMSNLLTNAAKFTAPGGRIVVSARLGAGVVRIDVADNGSGIEPALLPYVFDLFTQGARTLDRAQSGLGLGLALVRSMLKLHGGTVRARSDATQGGSVFTVELPVLDDAAAAHPAQQGAEASAPTRPLRILVVDDNADSAETLCGLLCAAGHLATALTDARAVEARAALERPEVYILDIGMPDIDGYELARRLRAHPAAAGALMLAVTGYGQPDDKQQALRAGFDHHFVKPVNALQLLDLLHAYAARQDSGAVP